MHAFYREDQVNFCILSLSEGVIDFAAKKSNTSQIVTIVVVPSVVLVTLVAVACAILLYRRSKKGAHGKKNMIIWTLLVLICFKMFRF